MGRNEKKKYMKKESQLLLIIVCYFNDIGRSSSSLIPDSVYIVCRMAFCSIFPSQHLEFLHRLRSHMKN